MAQRLADDGPDPARIRATVGARMASEPARKGSILDALRRSPLVGAGLEQVADTCNVLAMDARAFRRWARLMHRRSDHLIEDAMIAATAEVHNLRVVTRNVRDFESIRGAKR